MFAIEAFARHGLRTYSSPAQEVLADFGARGITVDQLYTMLGDMEAWGCMSILEDRGKSTSGVEPFVLETPWYSECPLSEVSPFTVML